MTWKPETQVSNALKSPYMMILAGLSCAATLVLIGLTFVEVIRAEKYRRQGTLIQLCRDHGEFVNRKWRYHPDLGCFQDCGNGDWQPAFAGVFNRVPAPCPRGK